MKKQNRQTDSKLVLNRETLTTLSPAVLEDVNGGTHPTLTLTTTTTIIASHPKIGCK